MEFDKTKVYTVLNADELKKGDKVFTANTLADLKKAVAAGTNIKVLDGILGENEFGRFSWYSVEQCFACSSALAYLVEKTSGSQKDKFRPFNNTKELIECWAQKIGYREKACTMPLIWIKSKTNGYVESVVGFSLATVSIKSCACVISMYELFNNYTFLDDSPCGIQTFFDK